MNTKFDKFLKTNASLIITTVLFNAFFFIIVFLFYGFFVNNAPFPVSSPSENSITEDRSAVSVVAKSEPAVVSIIATTDLPRISEEERMLLEFFAPGVVLPKDGGQTEVAGASGFFVTNNGLIVTNRHVVENKSLEYTVITSDGKSFKAEVVAKDPVYDVAILRIEAKDTPYLEFGDSSKISLGQTVLAIGNALSEFSNSVTKGIVSGLSRSVLARGDQGQTEMLENVIQTDAGINPGNSGGPLLDLSGRVVGVNVAVVRGSENIGFALPSNLVRSIVQSVKENGKIVVPFVGVRYVVLDKQTAEKEGLPVSEGVLLVRGEGANEPAVIAHSPAAKIKLKEGDIITAFNGKPINKDNSFARLIREAGIGKAIPLTVIRHDKTLHLSVVLEEAPNNLN